MAKSKALAPPGMKTSAALFTVGLACLAVFNLYWAASVEHETEVGAGGRYRPPQEPLPKAVDPLLRGLTVDAANAVPPSPVRAPTAAECKSAAVAAAPATPPTRVRKYSRQTTERCQQTADETEVCFYDGPICYDGERIVVFTDKPKGTDRRTSMCFDFRHYVSSYTCTYGDGFERPGLPPDTTPEVLYDQVPGVGGYGSLANSWGPQGKEVQFREEHPSLLTRQGLIASNTSVYWLKAGALGTGWDGGDASEETLFTAARERGFMTPETLAAQRKAGADPDALPDEGDLTSGLYVSSVHHSWIDHVWHGAAAFMALWDVKRYNRTRGGPLPGFTPSTVPSDRSDGDPEPWASDFVGLPPGPGNPVRPMGAWVAPPMDHLIIAGDYRTVSGLQAGDHNIMTWLRGMLRLVTSSHTRVLFNSQYKALGVARNRLVCARRGVVTGYKPRIFSGECARSLLRPRRSFSPSCSPPHDRHWRRARVPSRGVPLRRHRQPPRQCVAAADDHDHHTEAQHPRHPQHDGSDLEAECNGHARGVGDHHGAHVVRAASRTHGEHGHPYMHARRCARERHVPARPRRRD